MWTRGMALVFAAAVFTVSAANAKDVGAQNTGAELREELRLMPLVRSGKATHPDRIRIGHLLGYLEGFADAYLQEQVRGARFAQDRYTFCLPNEFTVEDLLQAASAYLERHTEPHIDRAPAGAVLALAFHEVYPCRKR